MTLAQWLQTKRKTLDWFAREIEVANASVVAKYVNGTRMPRPDVMTRIIKVTNGEVTANDFYATGRAA